MTAPDDDAPLGSRRPLGPRRGGRAAVDGRSDAATTLDPAEIGTDLDEDDELDAVNRLMDFLKSPDTDNN